jgi:hypothetical protein
MMMLDFLKLYVSFSKPVVTVEESAIREARYLEEAGSRVNPRVPQFLRNWIREVNLPPLSKRQWDAIPYATTNDRLVFLKNYAKGHSYEQYRYYHHQWRYYTFDKVRLVSEERAGRLLSENRIPVPESYKDFVKDTDSSESLEYDFWVVSSWLDTSGVVDLKGHFDTPVLTKASIDYLRSYVSQAPNAWTIWDDPMMGGGFWAPHTELNLLSGEVVGAIHHIPKKGTVKRRPIAVPNRFLQQGLVPIHEQLANFIRRLPMDCTFNQDRFDLKISNRVTNPNLYVGSVDLSQATDNIPLDWGRYCVEKLLIWRCSPTVVKSWNLFLEMARGRWDNNSIASKWTVGQPLGTLPSFPLLAITHNLLLESLSFAKGYGHSPYCILGDDLVVFNKKLRKAYIGFMQQAGVPLSLHKSYEGNLVEFAGKIFIRNQVPAYNSDHSALTWNSLFDYQIATGVSVPWHLLPRRIKAKFEQVVINSGLPRDDSITVYDFASYCLHHRTGSLRSIPHQYTTDQIANFLLAVDSFKGPNWVDRPDPLPDPEQSTGIFLLGGHPVTYADIGYACKGGHLQRFRKVLLPQWYIDKFRPCATDKIVSSAVSALKSVE